MGTARPAARQVPTLSEEAMLTPSQLSALSVRLKSMKSDAINWYCYTCGASGQDNRFIGSAGKVLPGSDMQKEHARGPRIDGESGICTAVEWRARSYLDRRNIPSEDVVWRGCAEWSKGNIK